MDVKRTLSPQTQFHTYLFLFTSLTPFLSYLPHTLNNTLPHSTLPNCFLNGHLNSRIIAGIFSCVSDMKLITRDQWGKDHSASHLGLHYILKYKMKKEKQNPTPTPTHTHTQTFTSGVRCALYIGVYPFLA